MTAAPLTTNNNTDVKDSQEGRRPSSGRPGHG